MTTYMLLDGERMFRQWRRVLRKSDIDENFDTMIDLTDDFQRNLAKQYMTAKIDRGLNFERFQKYAFGYTDQILNLLEQGHTILLNPNGGYFILTDSMVILDEIESERFPRSVPEKLGLNGWVSPEGKFSSCEYGENHIFANENPTVDLDSYISLSSNSYDDKESIIFLPNMLTDRQVEWLKSNWINLDLSQVMVLKEKKIV